ncbi:MAG: isoleucine--tRNA ligase [Candidatus Pacebacteria bacterium]|nr:isoleucine--tRNA ligase [Candidatus Paceibacterota bacterium]
MNFDFAKKEEEILKFWKKNNIFEKLRNKNQGKERWSFLDGPITANNPMGVHHAWGRTYKDVFQRYKAMQGFDERFQNGFDCQGLWVEVEVEKELGFKNKKDIENYGVEKFVEKCKERVFKYSKIQTEQSIRLGQWMDWGNSYYTMSDENNYAIWNFLKKCDEKGWIYKGHDTVAWCPRCETAISQHEILTEDYKEITHDSVFFRLPIINEGNKEWENTYLLVWTTTPWTIPANVAIGINSKYTYGIWEDKKSKEKYVFLLSGEEKKPPVREVQKNGGALSLEAWIMQDLGKTLGNIKTIEAEELLNLKYKGPFDDLEIVKNAQKENPETFHSIVDVRDIVNDEEGTGLLHIAPGAGQEDFKIGKKEKLSIISPIADNADYLEGMGEFTGKNAKKQPEIIINKLGDYFFNKKSYLHRYPACWRCKEELVWKVADEWYISMEKLRDELIDITKKIKWIPSFGLERELDWLKNMDDWLISKKNRYWGLALPIYECKKCGNFEIIGSREELKERAIEGWEEFKGKSPHKPWIDKVKIKCSKCEEVVSRIADVGNPWLDAGIVPFSTLNYFSDRKYWEDWFPIEFICESFPGQFKNWFYSLIVMSTVLEEKPPTKTIFGYASVVDEKGEEMHKSKGNAIWFDDAIGKIGADVMRWIYVKQNPFYNLRFGYHVAEETKRKLLNLLNSYTFFKTYISEEEINNLDINNIKGKNALDKWILSKINGLIDEVNKNLEKYDSTKASMLIENFFIEDLSLWYIRRSRKRFQKPKDKKEKEDAAETLYFVLFNLIKLMAPMVPFLSEQIYLDLKNKNIPEESVHLFDYPKVDKNLIDKKLEEKMNKVREIVTLALSKRKEAGMKVRQPLNNLQINDKEIAEKKELSDLIKEELNVKEVTFGKSLKLDTKITKELKEEGFLREITRAIQEMRKKGGLSKENVIEIHYKGDEKNSNILKKKKNFVKEETLAKDLLEKEKPPYLKEIIKVKGKIFYVERDEKGRFTDITNIRKSIREDMQKKARKKFKRGEELWLGIKKK